MFGEYVEKKFVIEFENNVTIRKLQYKHAQ